MDILKNNETEIAEKSQEDKVIEEILLGINDMEPGSDGKRREAETYKLMVAAKAESEKAKAESAKAEAEAVKIKQNWWSVAFAGLGVVGSMVLSYIMYNRPYKEMERNNFVTSQVDKDNQREARSSVKDILRKTTRL